MFAGAQYDLDCTCNACRLTGTLDGLGVLTWIRRLVVGGRRSPQAMVTLAGGLGSVNREP